MIEFKTNMFDIAKFIGVGLLIAFLWFNYGKFTSWVNRPDVSDMFTPRIEALESGLVKYAAMANTERLEQMINDLKEQNSNALAVLKEEGKKVDELTLVVTNMKSESGIQSGDVYKDEDKVDEPSTKDFADTVIYRSDDNGEELPMARVFFHPYIEDEPWTVQNFPLQLHTDVLQVENESGIYENIVETYFTNDFVESSKDKKYYFNSDVRWAKRVKSEKSFRFNLRLGFGAAVSTDEFFSGLDISIASYGRTKRDIDWRFFTSGVGGNSDNVFGYFKPFEYNIGNFIPLIENLFIGPFISTGSNGREFGGGLSVLF